MKINNNEVTVESVWTTKEREYFYKVLSIVEADRFPIKTKQCDFYGNDIKSTADEYTFTYDGKYMTDKDSSFDIAEKWCPEKVLRLGEIWESTKGENWKVVKVNMTFYTPIECVCLNSPEGTEPLKEERFLPYGEWKANEFSNSQDPGNLVKLIGMAVVKGAQYVEPGETRLVELTEDVYYEQHEEVLQVSECISPQYLWKEVITEPVIENITDSELIKEVAKSNGIKLVDKLFKFVKTSINDKDTTEVVHSKLVVLEKINTLKQSMEKLYGH